MVENLSEVDIARILDRASQLQRARLTDEIVNRPFKVRELTIALDTARLESDPLVIEFPFKSIYADDATDNDVSIRFKPTTKDLIQSHFRIKKNASWNCENQIPRAFLHWAAQAGKTITLIFFIDSTFQSGQLISVNSGGVSINNGSVVTNAVVTLAAATAAVVLAQNTNRFVGLVQNNTGASIWVGPSAVTSSGANRGIEVQPGDTFPWNNTAALYAYSVLGGDVVAMTQT